MSRSIKSAKNLIYALTGQFFGLVISFVARIFFIKILGEVYLGVNGLFSNILTVLSLAELGIGEAITYSLYGPLAKKDEKKCVMFMQLYKKIYNIIGVVIFILGLMIAPFLNFFVAESTEIENLKFIFLLYVINTSASYFFSYKKNLIIADQNRYIVSFYRYIFFFLVNLFQIIFLYITKDFIIYLCIQIIMTLLENIVVSKKADNMYPFLKNKEKVKMDKETKDIIKNNTKAMLMHKVGGVVVCSTDNIIISKFVSLVSVGIYSNYYMITNALNIIFSQIYSSITASIGNLCIMDDSNRKLEVFNKINFLGFWVYSVSSICLLCLLNPFIELWLGDKYLFPMNIVLMIVVNFYTIGMRKAVLTYREAAGLFYKDRWKSIFEAVLNLILSIIMALKWRCFWCFVSNISKFYSVKFLARTLYFI